MKFDDTVGGEGTYPALVIVVDDIAGGDTVVAIIVVLLSLFGKQAELAVLTPITIIATRTKTNPKSFIETSFFV